MDHLELLLLEDIPGIGQRNDIIVVRSGFALNNLLPRRRAIVATPTVRKRYAEHIKRRAEEKAREQDLARSAAAVLQSKPLVITKKATEAGKLFGAVSAKEVSEILSSDFQIEIAEANVLIAESIKSLGTHTAKVKIGKQEIPVKIEVKTESEATEAA